MNQKSSEVEMAVNRGAIAAPETAFLRRGVVLAGVVGLFVLAGCGARIPLLPNSDPALRKRPAEFSSDAALRHPFKDDAPSGGEAKGRAAVDYGQAWLEVVNLSEEDWDDAEIWINRRYVVFVPRFEKGAPKVTTLNFWMFFDEKNNSFPTADNSGANRITRLEMYRAGKIYTLKMQLAD